MSPILTSPTRGYGDFSRVVNWDDNTTESASQVVTPGSSVFVQLDVSRFLNIYIWDQVQSGDAQVDLLWTTTLGGSVALGTRHIFLSSGVPGVAQYSVVNRGPFVQVSWLNISAGNITHHAQVTPTNRTNPLEFTPLSAQLIDVEGVSIGANNSATWYPANYYAGPCTVWASPGAAGARLDLYTLKANDVWERSSGWTLASGDNNLSMVAPPGAWRLTMTMGTNATTTANLAVMPSMTGAA